MLVHDGPWARDRLTFQPDVQLLANRGYAVLQVNFRGSSGGGKRLMQSGNRAWGGAMNDDLVDAVKWAVDQGRVDARKVAIMGRGYGGFSTLMSLANDASVFSCGVDAFGPLTTATMFNAAASERAVLTRRIGNPNDPADKDVLAKANALSSVEKIRAPVLVAHGAEDVRVKSTEVDQLVAALEKKGQLVTVVMYLDEGAGFSRLENELDFYARVEGFFARCLGGRSEPMPREGRVPGSKGLSRTSGTWR